MAKSNEHSVLFYWGEFLLVCGGVSLVVLIMPLTFLGPFAPTEFYGVLAIPVYICAYRVFVGRDTLSNWPLVTLLLASAWYVWFAYVSMLVEPMESERSYIILWVATGGITGFVLYKLVSAVHRNRLLLVLTAPLVVSMAVGFCWFLGEFAYSVCGLSSFL